MVLKFISESKFWLRCFGIGVWVSELNRNLSLGIDVSESEYESQNRSLGTKAIGIGTNESRNEGLIIGIGTKMSRNRNEGDRNEGLMETNFFCVASRWSGCNGEDDVHQFTLLVPSVSAMWQFWFKFRQFYIFRVPAQCGGRKMRGLLQWLVFLWTISFQRLSTFENISYYIERTTYQKTRVSSLTVSYVVFTSWGREFNSRSGY